MIHTARQNPKFVLFIRRLRPQLSDSLIDCETVAVGLLERLWHIGVISAIRGDIGKFTDEMIAEGCGWYGDASQFVEILVECRWLDRDSTHRLVIHDWHTHAPSFVKGNASKKGGIIKSGDAVEAGPIGGAVEAGPITPGVPNTTEPNPTKPNLFKQRTRASVRPLEIEDMEKIRTRCQEIKLAVDPNPRLHLKPQDRELCVKAAAMEYWGMLELEEILRTMKRARPKVSSRWGYFKGALRNEFERDGRQDFLEVLKAIKTPLTNGQLVG